MSEQSSPPVPWTIVKTFTSGQCLAEVSRSGESSRFSYRLTWVDGARRGPWFPDRGISYAEQMRQACHLAEGYIVDEQARITNEQEARLANRKEREAQRRDAVGRARTGGKKA